jgi:hypothetical protein
MSRKTQAAAVAGLTAVVLAVAVLAVVSFSQPQARPRALLQRAPLPQNILAARRIRAVQPAKTQMLWLRNLISNAVSHVSNAVSNIADTVQNHVQQAHETISNHIDSAKDKIMGHICDRFNPDFCPDAPIDTSLPPLDPIVNEEEPEEEYEEPILSSAPPSDDYGLPELGSGPVVDEMGLPELDSNGSPVNFDSAGYADNAHTLSSWQAHQPGWIYQGDQDEGPQYTIDPVKGTYGPEIHDTTFNVLDNIDSDYGENDGWSHVDIDPSSVEPLYDNLY